MFHQKAVIADLAVPRSDFDLKRAALLFEQVIVLETAPSRWDPLTRSLKEANGLFGPETDWLAENGIIRFELDETVDSIAKSDPVYAAERASFQSALCSSLMCRYDSPQFDSIIRKGALRSARSAAIVLQEREGAAIAPLVPGGLCASRGQAASGVSSTDLAMMVVLRKLPTPDPLTPWEAILEYRQDPDAQRAFVHLRRWMYDAIAGNRSTPDLENLLESELQTYEEHLRIHRLKYRNLRLEAAVVAPLEIVEKVLKLQFGAAAKALLTFSTIRLERMESERQLPNRALHYLVDVGERLAPT